MNTKYGIAGIVLGIICVYFLSGVIADSKTDVFVEYGEADLEVQLDEIKATATVLGRGASSEDVDSIVPDCSSQDLTKYDTLLASLDKGLNKNQLVELKSLFDRCGDRASLKRSVMAFKLSHQVKTLQKTLTLLSKIDEDKYSEVKLDTWKNLADKEVEIAALFSELVFAQDEIISTLLGNVSSNVRSVEEIRIEAEGIKSKLTTATEEASKLRSELM